MNKQLKFHYLILLYVLCSCKQSPNWLNKDIVIDNISQTKDSFDIIQNGKVAGYWLWEMNANDTEIEFKDESVLTGMIKETFDMIISTETLHTASVDMNLEMGAINQKVKFARKNNSHLNGELVLTGERNETKLIDTMYQKKTIVRAEVFGLLPYVKKPKELNELLDVFFMSTGTVGEMKLSYVNEETIKISSGTYDVFKIEFKGDNVPVSNNIYIRKEFPHRIIKVEVIDQPLTIESITHLKN